ncbi:hypothetical protein [Draconibacterium halophilum]|uniref:NIPSNAP protein n=1 Tax=Draconibacterium halophilum TaxID=2706887 RepID=A0A6C0R9C8_9BACT|nr:hypothetical protein [Draconibacterium halophilum]QIA06486.1 hypothetical protein G0Q07_01520 [Draconibacterium halophilum]
MKTTGIIICLFLFMGIVSLQTQAQEAPAMPQTFFVMEEFVEPVNLQEFNKVQQEAVDLWKELEFDVPIYTYRTDMSSFYWVVPIENFGGMDKMFGKVNELSAQMKEKGYDANKKFRDLSTTRETVIHWEIDLSYHPNEEMGQSVDKPYCEWTFFYLKSGHEKELAEAVKKYIEFSKSIEEDWSWDLYSVYMGYDSPCWIVMDRAENPLSMRKLEASLQEKHSEKLGELWKNMQPHLRKMETTTGWFLPKWSLNYEQ